MFSLYFLDTCINMVKYLQRVPFDVSLNWRYLHQDAGKTYSEISKRRSYWKYQKQPSADIWKRKTKLFVQQKGNVLQETKHFQEEIGNLFCKKM